MSLAGQAAAPAITLMKLRRRIALPEAKDRAWLVQLQQGFATGEMGFRVSFARQQF
jgi:hypothetical protein